MLKYKYMKYEVNFMNWLNEIEKYKEDIVGKDVLMKFQIVGC